MCLKRHMALLVREKGQAVEFRDKLSSDSKTGIASIKDAGKSEELTTLQPTQAGGMCKQSDDGVTDKEQEVRACHTRRVWDATENG